MDIFDVLTMVGGLCLFLFGMDLMGQALERRAGNGLRSILGKLTTNKLAGFATGLGVTSVIQSSSATTVMVVGFVNSGLMTLRQAINVIMGANVGTTVTAWVLSLSGIEGDALWLQLLKPSSFTPVLALIGIVMYMFLKNSKSKDTGTILLGFATLMFGMETMSGAVKGLAAVPAFRELFLLFENPILGMLVGAVLTGVIQSSSASVGILQALSATGAVSYGAAVPIIMGQNIGTCVTALISSVGANKNAKRAALVHLSFNIIGTVVWLTLFSVADAIFHPALLGQPATEAGIAVAHSLFNIACTALLLPMSGLLEKLACKLVPDAKAKETVAVLDDRLLETPFMALERCNVVAGELGATAVNALHGSMLTLREYTPALAAQVRKDESASDEYEDILGTYLVKLSSCQLSDADSAETLKLLKIIGDFERISDHSVNIVESVEELREKDMQFSETAAAELAVITAAVDEILVLTLEAFTQNDLAKAAQVEPLEQVIDDLKEKLRTRHILRLQQGNCTIEAGFVWADLLTNLERTSDHCSNIAECMIDVAHNNMNLHESLHRVHRESAEFKQQFEAYSAKYALPVM